MIYKIGAVPILAQPRQRLWTLRVKQKEPRTLVRLSYSLRKCCQLHSNLVKSFYKRRFFSLGESCWLAVY